MRKALRDIQEIRTDLRIVDEDKSVVWDKTAIEPDMECIDASKWTLAKHQRFALAAMDANKALMIAYDMGTGKTAIALHWILQHLKMDGDGHIDDALIIVPASLIPSWTKAISTMARFEGVTPEDVVLLSDKVTIVSYIKTYAIESQVRYRKDGRAVSKKTVRIRANLDHRWGAIFVDESHNIGNHSSVQTNVAMTMAKLTDYRFVMTATPVHGGKGKEDFSKLFGQINFLHPGRWPTWSAFVRECVTELNRWYQPVRFNTEHCRDILWSNGISCRLQDVFEMPLKSDCMTPVKMDSKAKKVYKDILAGRWDAYNLDVKTSGVAFRKTLQICSGSLKTELGVESYTCSKDEVLRDVIDGCDGKVVVFCDFKASVARCAKIAKECGKDVIAYDGDARQDSWMRFQYGDADVIVCQYQRGGVGLDLFAASTMVMFEPCFSATLFEQAKGRIFRKGQTCPCTYYYLYNEGTLEEKVLNTVRSGVTVNEDMLVDWAHIENSQPNRKRSEDSSNRE